ncbi:MAG: hypothetical protein ABI747_03830 [Candidatus Moraniibacteriota bacterium]
MSLKILIFPIFIILSLTLAIGYIKPDIETVLVKKEQIAKREEDLAKVDAVIRNVSLLNAQIEGRASSETFVLKYLPKSLEEERVLDAFNFLAGQTGVIIKSASAKENAPQEKARAQVERASLSFQALSQVQGPEGESAVEVSTRIVHSYAAMATVIGSYQGLKDFFERLSRADRIHEIKTFSIREPERDPKNGEETLPADFLEGKFEADFIHYPTTQVSTALGQPMFESGKFDFAGADALLDFVTSPLSSLEVQLNGRPNPFQ